MDCERVVVVVVVMIEVREMFLVACCVDGEMDIFISFAGL